MTELAQTNGSHSALRKYKSSFTNIDLSSYKISKRVFKNKCRAYELAFNRKYREKILNTKKKQKKEMWRLIK